MSIPPFLAFPLMQAVFRPSAPVQGTQALICAVLDFENGVRRLDSKDLQAVQSRISGFCMAMASELQAEGLASPKTRADFLRLWQALSKKVYSVASSGTQELLLDAFSARQPVLDCYSSALLEGFVFCELGFSCRLADCGEHVLLRVEAPSGPLFLETRAENPSFGGPTKYFYTSSDDIYRCRFNTAVLSEVPFGPGMAGAPFMLVNRSLAALDSRQRLADLHQARAANPNYSFGRYNLGVYYEKAGQLDMALVEYRAAAKLAPHYLLFFDTLGQVEMGAGHYAAAVAAFSQLISLEPFAPAVYLDRAKAYEKLGMRAESQRDLKTYREQAARASGQ